MFDAAPEQRNRPWSEIDLNDTALGALTDAPLRPAHGHGTDFKVTADGLRSFRLP